jgi:hypothetical protein
MSGPQVAAKGSPASKWASGSGESAGCLDVKRATGPQVKQRHERYPGIAES